MFILFLKAQSTLTMVPLSLFLCNVQHLSEAKKAQQSLEGTYKQLDNVSFSLWWRLCSGGVSHCVFERVVEPPDQTALDEFTSLSKACVCYVSLWHVSADCGESALLSLLFLLSVGYRGIESDCLLIVSVAIVFGQECKQTRTHSNTLEAADIFQLTMSRYFTPLKG